MTKYFLHKLDPVNQRVYYLTGSRDERLYCIQYNGKACYAFLACNAAGEPSHPISFPEAHAFDQQVFPNV